MGLIFLNMLKNADKELSGRLHLGSADKLPFNDNSFDAVLSINNNHNPIKKSLRLLRKLKEYQKEKVLFK